jgi:hypothetical protein
MQPYLYLQKNVDISLFFKSSKIDKLSWSYNATNFKTCIWKHILVSFSKILCLSPSKYSTFFTNWAKISPRNAYTSCTFENFASGTPYKQHVLPTPSSYGSFNDLSTTSLASFKPHASLAWSLNFKHSANVVLNFSCSFWFHFSLDVMTVVIAQLTRWPLAFELRNL